MMYIYIYIHIYIYTLRKRESLFFVYGSVHRWSKLIIVQRDETQSSLFVILQVHSTFFGFQPHPSSGVHKTVTTAPGTGHIFFRRLINRLLCVAFRWKTINIEIFLLSVQAIHIVTTVFWKVKRDTVISLISMKYYYVRKRSSCICLRY